MIHQLNITKQLVGTPTASWTSSSMFTAILDHLGPSCKGLTIFARLHPTLGSTTGIFWQDPSTIRVVFGLPWTPTFCSGVSSQLRSPTSSPAFRQLWPRCHQDLHLCVTQSFEDLLGRLHSDMSLHFWVNIFLEARQIRQCSSVENEAGISDTTNCFGYCSWLHRFSKQFKVLTSRDRFDIPPRQLEGDALLLLSGNDSEVVSFRMMSSSSSNPLYYTSSCSSAHNNHKRHQWSIVFEQPGMLCHSGPHLWPWLLGFSWLACCAPQLLHFDVAAVNPSMPTFARLVHGAFALSVL